MGENEVLGMDVIVRLDKLRADLALIPGIGAKEAKLLTGQLAREVKAQQQHVTAAVAAEARELERIAATQASATRKAAAMTEAASRSMMSASELAQADLRKEIALLDQLAAEGAEATAVEKARQAVIISGRSRIEAATRMDMGLPALTKNMTAATGAARGMSGGFNNLAMQLPDVWTQIEMGTPPLRVLQQQGLQVVQMQMAMGTSFAWLLPFLGAALPVLAVFGATWGVLALEEKRATDKAKEWASTATNAQTVTLAFQGTLADIRQEYDLVTDAITAADVAEKKRLQTLSLNTREEKKFVTTRLEAVQKERQEIGKAINDRMQYYGRGTWQIDALTAEQKRIAGLDELIAKDEAAAAQEALYGRELSMVAIKEDQGRFLIEATTDAKKTATAATVAHTAALKEQARVMSEEQQLRGMLATADMEARNAAKKARTDEGATILAQQRSQDEALRTELRAMNEWEKSERERNQNEEIASKQAVFSKTMAISAASAHALGSVGDLITGRMKEGSEEQFEAQRKISIAQIGLLAPQAVAQAMAQLGPIAGPIISGIQIAAQLAAVGLAKPPAFEIGGIDTGSKGGSGHLAWLHGTEANPEVISSAQQTRAAGGPLAVQDRVAGRTGQVTDLFLDSHRVGRGVARDDKRAGTMARYGSGQAAKAGRASDQPGWRAA